MRAVWLGLVLGGCAFAQGLSRGERLFGAHCAACHGPDGQGARGVNLTGRLTRAPSDEALFNLIRKGIPGTEMPGAPLGDAEIRDLVVFVRTLERHTAPAPATGAARGEQIYRHKGGCAKCHAIAGRGGVTGPELTDIGARRSADYLRTALVDPQAAVPENFGQYRWYTLIPDNFLQVRLVTGDGRAITGARLNEDPFSIQVRDYSGRVHSFWKSELRELHKDWGRSPMPSFRNTLTPAEIEDVVAYLASLRGGS